MINSTILQNLDYNTFIELAHKQTAMPALIALFSFTFIVLLCVGLITTSNKGKFMTIFIFTFLLSFACLITLIFIPTLTQSIYQLFS
jgi:hypothetical protein